MNWLLIVNRFSDISIKNYSYFPNPSWIKIQFFENRFLDSKDFLLNRIEDCFTVFKKLVFEMATLI